jgi:hypothetical protein
VSIQARQHSQRTAATAYLSVWVYESPLGAAAGRLRLQRLCLRGAVTLDDATTLAWVRGAHRPRVVNPAPGPVLRDLVSLLLPPYDGETVLGLDDAFLAEVRTALVPGSSAMLVLSSDARPELVRPVIERGLARGGLRLLAAPVDP